MKTRMNIMLTQKTRKILEQTAKKENRKMSTIIEIALQKYCEAQK